MRLEVDTGGVVSIVASQDRRGNIGSGEIHLRRVVLLHVQPRHVRAIYAEVGRVVVKERKRAGQLGLFVYNLEKNNNKLHYSMPQMRFTRAMRVNQNIKAVGCNTKPMSAG